MTEEEFQSLKSKIERQFLLRLKLSELTGRPKINPKNFKALMDFDQSIAELFLEIAIQKPENLMAALILVKGD